MLDILSFPCSLPQFKILKKQTKQKTKILALCFEIVLSNKCVCVCVFLGILSREPTDNPMQVLNQLTNETGPGMLAHAYNPSCMGGGDDRILIPGQPVQKSARPHLNKQAEIYGLCL
jgi:hypothetical protein